LVRYFLQRDYSLYLGIHAQYNANRSSFKRVGHRMWDSVFVETAILRMNSYGRRKRLISCLIILCMQAWPSAAPKAQNSIMKHYGSFEGLACGNLYDVHEDAEQRLWFASEKGLLEFDGKSFNVVDGSLSGTEIIKISEDRSGAIWLHTLSGIPIQYSTQRGITHLGPEAKAALRGANYVSAFSQAPDGRIYFGTNDGRAFCIHPDGKFEFLFKTTYGTIVLIEHTHDCEAVFHFSHTMAIGHLEQGKLRIVQQKPLFEFGEWRYGILRVAPYSGKRFLYGLEQAFHVVELSGDTMRKVLSVPLAEKNIIFIERDRWGDVWVGTTEGAIKFDSKDTLFRAPRKYLVGKTVNAIMRDHENGLWFMSTDGIYHCRNENVRAIGWPEEKAKGEVSALHLASDGNIYAGFSNGGLNRFNRKTGAEEAHFDLRFSNSAPDIHKIEDGPDGSLIVAGNSGLFSIVDDEVKTLSRYKFADFSHFGSTACGCFYSGWRLMALDSLLYYPEQTQKMISQTIANRSYRCHKAEFVGPEEAWVVNAADLLRIRGNAVDTVAKGVGEAISFLKALGGGNAIAIGTHGQGIYIYKNARIQQITFREGLLDNEIKDVATDGRGALWVLTAKGISKFVSQAGKEYQQELSRNVSMIADRLPIEKILIVGDTIWGATREGCISFPIEELKRELVIPDTKITGLWVNNISQSTSGPLKFSHTENRILVKFRSSSWGDGSLIEYRYRILGIDTLYQTTTSEILDLPGLAPNDYVLEIQSRYSSEPWGSKKARLEFKILPPFWRTWWFIVATLIVILLLVGIGVQYLLRNARRKSMIREALLTAKHNALMSQMNPHFIFNSLNSIQYFVLSKETALASDYLADFASLMRAILVNARSAFIVLSDEVRFLELYLRLESLRLGHSFDFSLSLSPDVMPSTISIPTMMLQPLVENSIWHGVASLKGRRGRIVLSFSISNGFLCCQIVDNGVGREANKANKHSNNGGNHKSVSSEILNERITLLNETLKTKIRFEIVDLLDEKGNANGTEVKVSFPINMLNPEIE
jgi:ligand-binding sensor domain-containing protein